MQIHSAVRHKVLKELSAESFVLEEGRRGELPLKNDFQIRTGMSFPYLKDNQLAALNVNLERDRTTGQSPARQQICAHSIEVLGGRV